MRAAVCFLCSCLFICFFFVLGRGVCLVLWLFVFVCLLCLFVLRFLFCWFLVICFYDCLFIWLFVFLAVCLCDYFLCRQTPSYHQSSLILLIRLTNSASREFTC